jgi:hypothetical protein
MRRRRVLSSFCKLLAEAPETRYRIDIVATTAVKCRNGAQVQKDIV